MNILTIGGATQDIIIIHKHPETVHFCMAHEKRSFLLLEEGKKIDVDEVLYLSGGGATNSAVFFKGYGFKTSAFFKIGTDQPGDFIYDHLKNVGINLSSVIRSTTMPTSVACIIPTPSGDRTILVSRGATQTVTKNDIPFDAIKSSDQLYITSLSGQSSALLPEITSFAKQHNIPVATNPGSSQLVAGADTLQEALPNIDILILNSDEANMLMASLVRTDSMLHKQLVQQPQQPKKELPLLLQQAITYQTICFDLKHFFAEVLARGPKIVVVTNGAEGVYVATNDSVLFHPSLDAPVVSTLGAGDAFGSCFVASLVDNYTLEESIVRGIINATSVIGFYGAQQGLLAKQELAERFKKIGINALQMFPLTL